MFLDDSACNLASVNLTKFLHEDGRFDVDGYRHACRVFFIAQEILVDLSSYPTAPIAKNSHDYRPLGLGYANLGSLLMQLGVPYDSDEGRSIAAALTAIMCGHAYKTSAEMAASKEPFAGFARNREPMLRVMNMHRDAAYAIHRENSVIHSSRGDGIQAKPHTTTDLYKAACDRLGRGGEARRAARVPKRASDRARSDGHHRSLDGLRHDRHRARLRAREVQEARRWRVLQDRQSVGAPRRCRTSVIRPPRCRRSSPT